jgi:hypothetical protein
MRLLIAGQDRFLGEARAVLRPTGQARGLKAHGLSSAAWITVDDTAARHQARNGFCTQIGNAHFAWFGTTLSKSRRSFLELLRAGYDDYVINAEALAYMRRHHLAEPTIARLGGHVDRHFADRLAWQGHLDRLGITALKGRYDPVRVATEGALWGSVRAHGFLAQTAVVSKPAPAKAGDAGQFDFGRHGLCWVHAERLVHRLDSFTERQHAAQQRLRALIWGLYRDLKHYKADPSPRRRAELRVRFERIFTQHTGFATLDRLLARLHAKKPELLLVLDHPQIPLHTNGSENDIRCQSLPRGPSAHGLDPWGRPGSMRQPAAKE